MVLSNNTHESVRIYKDCSYRSVAITEQKDNVQKFIVVLAPIVKSISKPDMFIEDLVDDALQ